MRAFLIEPGALFSQLAFHPALLAQARTFFAFCLLFLLLFHQPVSGELDFLQAQLVELVADVHFHQRTQLRDGSPGCFESALGGLDVPQPQGSDAVVRFGVVGPQHELGQVIGHPPAFGQGVVEGKSVRFHDGPVGGDELSDPGLEVGETVAEGSGVFQGVVVTVNADVLEYSGVAELNVGLG